MNEPTEIRARFSNLQSAPTPLCQRLSRQKTKIIATLGGKRTTTNKSGRVEVRSTYKDGIFTVDHQEIREPTVKEIVDLFFFHHVDVIRINLAHIRTADVRTKFRAIKKAILAAEKKYNRRIGVLADLPGPKIRFNKSEWLIPKATLRVSFDKIGDLENVVEASVGKPPKESYAQINLDDQAFSDSSKEARAAVDLMLKAVKDKLTGDSASPLLAFIGDSDCTLEVRAVEDRTIVCDVVSVRAPNRVVGGSKGFTIRGIPKRIGAFTTQDKTKLTAILEEDLATPGRADQDNAERILSHIGISFCQTRDDVRQVLYHVVDNILKPFNPKRSFSELLIDAPLLIAKLETALGLENKDEILDFADGVMIARGDLAVEIETADVPRCSKEVIEHCNLRGKPVIMATQMLESMKESIECTRPEASDVFNAVVDNVDALMLSGETSSGKYPAHAIEKMRALAKNAEDFVEGKPKRNAQDEIEEKPIEGTLFMGDAQIQEHFRRLEEIKRRVDKWRNRWPTIGRAYIDKFIQKEITPEELLFIEELVRVKNERLEKQHSTDRITHAACLMSVDPIVKAIVAPTTSGRTARMLSRFRPERWILAQPHDTLTQRKLGIDRGVIVIGVLQVTKDSEHIDTLIRESRAQFESRFGKDETVIFTCGTPLGNVGTTNMIQRWDAKEMSVVD